MPIYMEWKLKEITEVIKGMQAIKFDCPIAICGHRGMGKSTLAYKVALKLGFDPEKDIVYSREELMKLLQNYDHTVIGDEMINAAYKREFHNVDQQELIKMLNMYRDHRNVILFCIPNFWDLDKPLRDLVKIRVDIVTRGEGIIHMPIKNVYSNDPWDMENNKKIEKKFVRRGVYKPKWTKLTTFKGKIFFGALPPDQEEKYQRIKDSKRANLRKDPDSIEEEEEKTFYARTLQLIKLGRIKTAEHLEAIAYSVKIPYVTLTNRLRRMLQNEPEGLALKSLIGRREVHITKVPQQSNTYPLIENEVAGFPISGENSTIKET